MCLLGNVRVSGSMKILTVVGWREWVELKDFNISAIKAKVDSGAKTSSLHAFDLEIHRRKTGDYVSFDIHPLQRNAKKSVRCRTKVLEFRKIKSSNGQTELRPVILMNIGFGGESFETEVTLTNRDEMGFRMLIGRKALRKRFLIDVSKSYLGTKATKKVSKKKKVLKKKILKKRLTKKKLNKVRAK